MMHGQPNIKLITGTFVGESIVIFIDLTVINLVVSAAFRFTSYQEVQVFLTNFQQCLPALVQKPLLLALSNCLAFTFTSVDRVSVFSNQKLVLINALYSFNNAYQAFCWASSMLFARCNQQQLESRGEQGCQSPILVHVLLYPFGYHTQYSSVCIRIN